MVIAATVWQYTNKGRKVMAYGEKYRIDLEHQFGGDERHFKILKKDYTGSYEDVSGGAAPGVCDVPGGDDDPLFPFFVGDFNISILVDTWDEFIEFATANNKEYIGQLYNVDTSNTEWQGWLVPEEYEQPYIQPPFELGLKFSTGLGFLSDVEYLDDGDYYTGRDREITILANAMSSINPSDEPLNINVMISLVPVGASSLPQYSALYLSYTDQEKYINDDGTVWSCLDVIRDILEPYGARLSMSRDGWWVIRVRDYAHIIEGYPVYYNVYTRAGVYDSNSYLDVDDLVMEITGPNSTSRADDVHWIERSQTMRIMRAHQQIRVRFDYQYRSMILLGNFENEKYDQLWDITGSAVRTQDPGKTDGYVLKKSAASTAEYNIPNISATGTPILLLKFSAMYTTSTYPLPSSADMQIDISIDATAGPSYDRGLNGQIGGGASADPTWASSWFALDITTPSGEIAPKQWVTFEVELPTFPYAGDLKIELKNADDGSSPSNIVNMYFKDIKLFGTYSGLETPKEDLIEFDISEDNISNPDPAVITGGDIDEDGNEWLFYRGAKSKDADGDQHTTSWWSHRREGGTKTGVGPKQKIQEYLRDALIMFHGSPLKRITGDLMADWPLMGIGIIKDDDDYFIPTSYSQEYKRGRIGVSMVEILGYKDRVDEDNLVENWDSIPGPADWDTRTITADPLIDELDDADGTAICGADDIEVGAYEKYLVEVTGTFDTDKPLLTIGSWSDDIEDGYSEVITPSTTDATVSITLDANGGSNNNHTNVLIKVTKAYGY